MKQKTFTLGLFFLLVLGLVASVRAVHLVGKWAAHRKGEQLPTPTRTAIPVEVFVPRLVETLETQGFEHHPESRRISGLSSAEAYTYGIKGGEKGDYIAVYIYEDGLVSFEMNIYDYFTGTHDVDLYAATLAKLYTPNLASWVTTAIEAILDNQDGNWTTTRDGQVDGYTIFVTISNQVITTSVTPP
jgi:hypothetical protein